MKFKKHTRFLDRCLLQHMDWNSLLYPEIQRARVNLMHNEWHRNIENNVCQVFLTVNSLWVLQCHVQLVQPHISLHRAGLVHKVRILMASTGCHSYSFQNFSKFMLLNFLRKSELWNTNLWITLQLFYVKLGH